MQRQSISAPADGLAFRLACRAALVVAALAWAAAAHAAAPGDLDSTFNGNGIVTDPFQSIFSAAFAVTVQVDGKIVVAGQSQGQLAVARFNDDGTLDDTFNSSSTPPGYNVLPGIGLASNSEAHAVTVGDGGTIIVAGESQTANKNLTVARFTSDGLLDYANFNSGSSANAGANVQTIGTGDSVANAIALQADGSIVAGGYATNSNIQQFALARFTSGGDLDTASFNSQGTYGAPGTVMTVVGSNVSVIQALAIQPDGRIVAAGTSSGGTPAEVALARYNSDGSPDTNFNPTGSGVSAGTLVTAIGTGDSFAYGLTLDADSKIIVAGQAENGSVKGFALARYSTDGTLDNTFGSKGNGTVITPVGSGAARAEAVAMQPDGKIVAVGFTTDSNSRKVLALVRYNADGSLDAGFGTGGIVMTPLGTAPADAQAQAVALSTDAKIAVAGTADSKLTVARYLAADKAWDLTPDAFSFQDVQRAVLPNTVQTSNIITVSGLGAGIHVPVTITDGEYAKYGSTTYTVNLGWATNADQFNVRHTAAPGQINTTLTIGGMISANNGKIVSGKTTADAFSSTSINILGGGSGAVAGLSLAALAAVWTLRRRRRARDALPRTLP